MNKLKTSLALALIVASGQVGAEAQKWLGILDILTDDVKGFSTGYCWSYATEEECMEEGRQTYGHDKIFRHVCIKAQDISKWDLDPDKGGKQRRDEPPDECYPPPEQPARGEERLLSLDIFDIYGGSVSGSCQLYPTAAKCMEAGEYHYSDKTAYRYECIKIQDDIRHEKCFKVKDETF